MNKTIYPRWNCGWAFRFALLRMSRNLVRNSSYTPWRDCEMLQVLHELWDFVIFFTLYQIGGKSCVRNSSYIPWWILFIPTHSDQHFAMLQVLQSYGTFVIFFRYSITCDENMLERTHQWKSQQQKLSVRTFTNFIIIYIPSGDAHLCEKI